MEENRNVEDNNIEHKNPSVEEETKEVDNPPIAKEIKEEKQDLAPVKNGKPGLIAALVLIVAVLGVALAYVLIFGLSGDKKDDKPTPTPIPQMTSGPVVTPDVTPSATTIPTDNIVEGELTVYERVEDGSLTIEKEKSDWAIPAFTIKTNSNNSEVLAVDGESFVLYRDGDIYLYNSKTKKSEKVNIDSNYKGYAIFSNEAGNKIIGIAYINSNETVGYYNVSLNKKLYDGKYKFYNMNQGSDYEAYYDNLNYTFNQINDSKIVIIDQKKVLLLDSTKEKVELSTEYDEGVVSPPYYATYKSGNKNIYTLESCVTEYCGIGTIYNDQFKEIYSGEVSVDLTSFYNEIVYLAERKESDKYAIKKIDLTGKNISSTDINGEIYMVYNNYAVYNKDSTIVVGNIDNNEIKEITKFESEWNFNEYESGYYTRKQLDNLGEKNKQEGLYIIIEYPDKDANGNYGMEYCYTPNKQLIEYPIKQEMGGRAKPVLYLYPEKETNVTVTFAHPEYLTTTYPKYINSWNVKVSPNGDMKDEDGKYYYALYWDEKRYNEATFHEGFYVESKDAIKFLEEKLSIIGLSDKERNEFIMYWLPVMEANKKNLVYFELTEERELGNKLIITPKPDSLLRVSIHIKKVNEKVSIKEQKLPTFKRIGFTAVEWGGMTY